MKLILFSAGVLVVAYAYYAWVKDQAKNLGAIEPWPGERILHELDRASFQYTGETHERAQKVANWVRDEQAIAAREARIREMDRRPARLRMVGR